jgi:hypothetical protein
VCIATAASEQASATEEVTRNVTQISNLAKESSEAAEQAAKSCDDLASLALDLRSAVSQFKVNPLDATTPGLPPPFISRTEAVSRENPARNLRPFSASAGR